MPTCILATSLLISATPIIRNTQQWISASWACSTTSIDVISPRDFLAFFDRDYNRVARLHVDSGWVPAGTRVEEFESAIRTVCEPIFNKPLKDISFGQVLVRLFTIARSFDMEIQPQLVLLQKTLLNIEGLGRQLYPELDLWQTGQPVLREWMAERTGPKAIVKRFREETAGDSLHGGSVADRHA